MWITDFFSKKSPDGKVKQELKMLDGSIPIFSSFGDNIYSSDVVQQAISCIVFEMKKLQIKHQKENGFGQISVQDSQIQWVLDNPNSYMTQSDFIEKICWNLLTSFNSYIIPEYINGKLVALYPIKPDYTTFVSYKNGEMGIEFKFNNGYTTEINYKDVIHLRYRYGKNDLLGGNKFGNPDFNELLKTLEINNTMMDNIPKSIKASYQVLSVLKQNMIMDNEKSRKNIQDLLDNLANNASGILPIDLTSEYIPITRSLQSVDPTVLKFIDEKILRTWGVSIPILTGDFTKEQYEAFYSKVIEPLVISFSQAFTRAIFSDRELGFNNKIVFYSKELAFMTSEQKIEFIKEVGGRGALTNGYILSIFGIDPEIAGDSKNVRMMSLNYIDTAIANQYQSQNVASTQKLNTINSVINKEPGGTDNA